VKANARHAGSEHRIPKRRTERAALLTPDAIRTAGAYAHRMSDTKRDVHIFVLQVWIEPQAGGPGSRRGYVEHVVTRERRYFSAFDEALAFVEAFARPREPG